MSLIEQIKNILNRANDDFKNHRKPMHGVVRRISGALRVNISKCMKDVGIDPTVDEYFTAYEDEVRQGMYEFAIDQLKIKIAKAKQKGASESELQMLTVEVQLFTSRVKRYMLLYAYDEEPRLRWIVPRYGVATYQAEVRSAGLYGCLYSYDEGRKQIKEALEA